jgi:leucyl-tRNA synthetase
MSNSAPETRRFDPGEVEPKWQEAWDEADVFHLDDDAGDPTYVLAMFPYPSGEMHMGHVRNYAITDVYARYRRMQGDDVLHPMGWDSFGLPAENAANQRDVDPRGWTMDCIDRMRSQMELMGLGLDWDREITTCEPEYFRWNQWLFLQCYEAGLVERQGAELNWCPDCETVLADENVNQHPDHPNGICWRCDSPIEYRDLDQWFFTTTDYADELYDTLDEMDGWPENVREMQRNWIGKQEGASVSFDLTTGDSVEIFTTRLDTIYGATFFALSPGHDLVDRLAAENEAVAEYVERVDQAETDLPETSGVFTGEYAENPATGEEIPVYVADYVLEDIGTGALYAVPAHDERDHAFAETHDIEIRQVVDPAPSADRDPDDIDVEAAAYTEDGVLVDSGEHSGLRSEAARERFVDLFDGEVRTVHSLRDWCISRQRYWGTPIPFVECPDCGYVQVPEAELPVELPEFVQTTGNPLDAAAEWKQTTCPDCGGPAQRETDTMDTFVDSSWYFLRFVSPDLESAPFDDRADDWLPVDQYVGGIEHATMHLIYSRFMTKVLDDIDLLDGVREPFDNLLTQGMVRKGGEAMSSSTGNVVSPEPFVESYGADTGRLFMLSAAQPEKDFDWTEEGAQSSYDFLQNVYGLVTAYVDGDIETGDGGAVDEHVAREIDATAATATDEFEQFRFNHAFQEIRDLVSLLRRYADHTAPRAETFERGLETVTKLLAPVAAHTAEELWEQLGHDGLVATADWPTADLPEGYDTARLLVENTREDVRDIVDVAGIETPRRIEIAVAPEWKYYAREQARGLDGNGNVVGQLMSDQRLRERGEDAADYAKELAGAGHLDEQLPPEREHETLHRAAWLLEREFDADVVVHEPGTVPEALAAKATPGRPGIRIEE